MARKRDETSRAAARREAEITLRAIPNVGPAPADDLIRLGITRLEDLAGRDSDELYGAPRSLGAGCLRGGGVLCKR